ncbi:MAG: translation initiation factor IF-2, partial [Deltaproteobacteria bacterium]|nr:translation initiation factor IF-2 [Deltaproteobacteria bacterium]
MSEVRVFELAQELNMPAKDLLIKMRKAGIPVTGNFSELSSKQAEIVRKMGKSAKGMILPKPAKESGKVRLRSTEKKLETSNKVKTSKTTEKSKIVTISTISKLDDEEVVAIPKRRVRKKKTEPVHSSEDSTVQVADKLKTDSEIEIISADATKDRPEKPVLESDLSKISTFESQETLSVSGDPASENKVKPDAETVDDSKHSKLTELDKNTDETVLPDSEKSGISENKSNKTKIIFKHSQTDDKESSSKNKGLGRPEFKNKRKGDGGQIDYNYLREKRPRRRRKDFPKKRFDSNISRKVSDPNTPKHVFNPRKKSIRIGNQVGVAELAGLIGIKVPEILKKLMSLGIMGTINQTITGETAELIAADFEITIEVESFELSDLLKEEELDVSELEERAPIVTIMGHVDHGKTSLLDKIRESRIASGEAGGITQHIGAYHLEVKGNQVTFLDTPGHEAFTSMRARGANITDIVVLVVASDDKVQPQTVEAIQHARAANVPIIVAINKIDRPESDPIRIQQELLSHELIPEDLGGSTIFVKVSAKTGDGIDELLEMIHLQAEILELKSTSKGFARGTIIESRVRKGQGPVGTVLVQRGTLKIGDYFVMGSIHGRIRAMFNEVGDTMIEAGPAIPVEISGLSNVPEVGAKFVVLEDEKIARQIAEDLELKLRSETIQEYQKTSLDNLFSKIDEGKVTELRLILKGDVQGSVEALKTSLQQIGDERISLRFLLCSVGNVTETDITLASASDAIIVGFNVQMDAKARETQSSEGVDVRLYDVIYNALDDVKAAMEGLLEPEIREEVLGHLEVRQVFSSGKNGIV